MRSALMALTLSGGLGLAGCAGIDTDTRDRTLTGAAVGAGSGAAVGLLTGRPLNQALTGALAGGVGGLIYDQIRKSRY